MTSFISGSWKNASVLSFNTAIMALWQIWTALYTVYLGFVEKSNALHLLKSTTAELGGVCNSLTRCRCNPLPRFTALIHTIPYNPFVLIASIPIGCHNQYKMAEVRFQLLTANITSRTTAPGS